jgi:hypothetical protein
LKVIGAVTQAMVKREELKRMREMGRPGMDGETPVSEAPKVVVEPKKIAATTDRVVSGVLSKTVGRVARFAGRRILGEIPETAKNGSFHETSPIPVAEVLLKAESAAISPSSVDGAELIEQAIAETLEKENKVKAQVDTEDEALFLELAQKKTDEQAINA